MTIEIRIPFTGLLVVWTCWPDAKIRRDPEGRIYMIYR